MIRLLYIDDDEFMREIAKSIIARHPEFLLMLAATGEEGVAIAKGEPVALVLLDLMMPGMDGQAVFEALRADPKTHDVPIALVTARTESSATEALRALGCAGIIAKPFKPAAFVSEIRALLGDEAGMSEGPDPRFHEFVPQFIQRTADDRSRLAALADRMGPGTPEVLAEIAQLAHRLVGAAGTFGFSRLSARARELDECTQQRNSDPAIMRDKLQKVLAAIDGVLALN
jgi:CheY-like chemotaxis protein